MRGPPAAVIVDDTDLGAGCRRPEPRSMPLPDARRRHSRDTSLHEATQTKRRSIQVWPRVADVVIEARDPDLPAAPDMLRPGQADSCC